MYMNSMASIGRGRPTALLSALRTLPAASTAPAMLATRSWVGVSLPPPGRCRVRKIVHRGAPRPVTKVPSILLGRCVHCESELEAELALILDACPGVMWFGEQPALLQYTHRGVIHTHFPDFAVATTEGREFVEVKFRHQVTDEVLERTALLTQRLHRYGVGYRLVTEDQIRGGTALANARKLLVRGREATTPIWTLQAYETVRQRGVTTLADFDWERPGSFDAAGVARQIIDGRLHIDMTATIGADTPVHLPRALAKENRLWR